MGVKMKMLRLKSLWVLLSALGVIAVAHALIVYPGYTHPQISLDTTMLERVRSWYQLQGILKP